MIEYLCAFFLWLALFMSSSTLASLLVKRGKTFAVLGMQGTLFALSLLFIVLFRLPLSLEPLYILQAVFLGFSLSLFLNWTERLLIGKVEPPDFLPEGLLWRVLLLLLLAPLSEEVMNRALIEGYLLSHGYFWGAIGLSAFLFALPHWMAFKGASIGKKAYVTGGAFLIGLAVGYLFAVSDSLLTAFAFHSSANLAGFIFSPRKKNS